MLEQTQMIRAGIQIAGLGNFVRKTPITHNGISHEGLKDFVLGWITDKDVINADNNNYNSAIKKNKRKSVAKMQQNKCSRTHSKGTFASSKTRNVKEHINYGNFETKQRTNVRISDRKHLTKVINFDRFSRQNRIETHRSKANHRLANPGLLVNQSQRELTNQSGRIRAPG